MEPSHSKLTRRDLLKGALSALALSPAWGSLAAQARLLQPPTADSTASAAGIIPRENLHAGTLHWLLGRAFKSRPCRGRCPEIEGYCSQTSVAAGDEIQFFVNTRNPTQREIQIEIFRMGFYGGTGARLMLSLGTLPVQRQPPPRVGPGRLQECRWAPTASLIIPHDWVSGVYLGKLQTLPDHLQSYVIFIVRDRRHADFVFQCSDLTWQAYNHWPGGFSLYHNGEARDYWGPDVAVSFDRPYAGHINVVRNRRTLGTGEWFLWEFPLAYWMEANGYDVTYISNLDTHADARLLRRGKGFLSVGHDEYYTIEMYDNLRAAIQDGLNVAFLSGNACYGRVELREGTSGRANRTLTRVDRFGPRNKAEIERFPHWSRLPWRSPSANALIGAHTVLPHIGVADWVCTAPGHWLYEGTDLSEGDRIPGLVGWEYHGDPAAIQDLEIVATGQTNGPDGPGTYAATVYPGPRDNFVFNASSCWWANGVAEPPGSIRPRYHGSPPGPDERVQRMTANLLHRIRQAPFPAALPSC